MVRTWIDFQELKRAVSLEMVLHRYNIQLRTAGMGKVRGHCPLPMHGSEKSSSSFTATMDKGIGGVWACQSRSCVAAREGKKGGGVLEFVAAMEKCSIRDAALKLADWFGVQTDSAVQSAPPQVVQSVQTPELVSEEKTENAESNTPLGFQLQGIDHKHPYLAERGVTEAQAREFGIGLFKGRGTMQGKIVIPIHSGNGELLAYAGRAIDGSEPRYKFPAGFHKSLELFNLHRVRGEVSVVLVEGFFDCMKVTQAGFPCVALMGLTMSVAQETLLAETFAEIVVLLDGDEAGRGAALGIADRLQRRVYHVQLVELPDGQQPDQLSGDELHQVLHSIAIVQ